MEQAEFIRGKKVRPLMNFSDEPVELPGYGPVPPVTDFVPEMKGLVPFGGWWGIAAPKGVPDEVLQKLDEAYKVAVNSEGFKNCASRRLWTGSATIGLSLKSWRPKIPPWSLGYSGKWA